MNKSFTVGIKEITYHVQNIPGIKSHNMAFAITCYFRLNTQNVCDTTMLYMYT